MEDVYHLRVIPAPCSSCEPFDLEVDPALTWDELRESLELYSGIAPEQQHIVYKGSILRPERIDCAATLHALGFRDHTKLYLSSNTTRNSLSSSRESSAVTTSEARSELTHNAFRHTGSGASSSARNDEFPRFMNRNRSPLEPDAFSPMASIPPQLQESFIDLLVSNPELMENLLQSNPQTRSLLRNPTLARELRDPNTLRDMLRASFTPQAREDMARSVELRMSHLSNMGGEAFMNSAFAEMVRSEEEGRWEDADEVDGRRLTPEEIQMRDEAVEAQTQPQAGRGSNTDPMPNPWAPAARAPDRSLRSGPEELFRGLLARQTPPEERPSHVSSHSDVWTALPLSAYSSLLRTASTPGEMPPSSPNAMGLMHHLFQNLTLQGERLNTGQPQQQNTPGESPSGVHSTPTVAGETLQEQVFGHFSAPPARNGEVRPLPRVGGDQVDSPPQRNARDDEPNEGTVPASSGLESQGATGEAEKKDSPGPADPKVEK